MEPTNTPNGANPFHTQRPIRPYHQADNDTTLPLTTIIRQQRATARAVPHRKNATARLGLLIAVPAVILAATFAAIVALHPTPTPAHAASGGLPTGLPTHFSFGLMDSPGGQTYLNDMRSRNGAAWDYRYQYLSGGANTGNGWATWNTPSGQFATYYMNDSGSNNYIPAFVYYQMLQSNGPSGGSEPANDLAHLADASVMNAYYADWALLMQKIGSYGKPALVIVEPDLWGFIEQAANGKGSNSAASIAASVASSGYPDAASYPNTAQGFAWALLHIRDHYAHNAVLALHASPWGTGANVTSDTSGSINAAALGAQNAQFMSSAGITGVPSGVSTFDVISNDIADHDSGQSGFWWDPQNIAYPNFTRYLTYVNALSSGTGRRVLLWQVPVGNQYFDTENNSQGHTQDNKAQYILGHIAAFAQAGVIGVLFGPGNGGTYAQDQRNDGVTNPAPISSYQCNGCNNHTSVYPDDDGGYLRIFVGQYDKSGGYSLTGAPSAPPTPGATVTPTTPTATPSQSCASPTISFGAGSAQPSTLAPGSTASLSAHLTASCATSALIDFEVYNSAGARVWQTAQDNQTLTGAAQTFTTSWTTPTTLASGTYTLQVGVFKPGWGATYGWDSNAATFTAQQTAPACAASPQITFNSGAVSPATATPGATVQVSVTLTASCATSALIDFEVYNSAGARVWQTAQSNQTLSGSSQTFTTTWTIPTSQATGPYTLMVGVFKPDWSVTYGWDSAAATLTIN